MAPSGGRLPGITLEELQGAPGVAAGMRYLTPDPEMPAGQGRLTGQETAMRRLALALAVGGVRAASPGRCMNYPGSMEGNRYRPP